MRRLRRYDRTQSSRVLLGVALLVLAVVGVALVPAINGRTVPGAAARQPPPMPPSAGSCYRSTDLVHALPCSTPHDVVAVTSWPLDQRGCCAARDRRCVRAAAELTGTLLTDPGLTSRPTWGPPPPAGAPFLTSGPGSTAVLGWSWVGCWWRSSAPASGSPAFTGVLAGRTLVQGLPDRLRPCLLAQTPVQCDRPHDTEMIASRLESTASGALLSSVDPQVVRSCQAAAAAALGVADPSYGGRLRVTTDSGPALADSPGYELDGSGMVTTVDGTPLRGQTNCQLAVLRDQRLTASLIGWGGRPLPLTG